MFTCGEPPKPLCVCLGQRSLAQLERRFTLTTLAALQLVKGLHFRTTSQLLASLNRRAREPEPAGSKRGLELTWPQVQMKFELVMFAQ